MPTNAITVESLQPRAFEGLKEPELLMAAFNRLQEEAGILNGGLTLANARRVVLADKEVVTPSEWTQLTPATGFVDDGPANGYAALSVRKDANGTAWVRGRVKSAAPTALDPIASLPDGYAPSAIERRVGDCTGYTLGVWAAYPDKTLRYLNGDASNDFHLFSSWVAKDKSLPAWPSPFRVRLPVDTASPSNVVVRSVLIAARTGSTADAGLSAVTMVHAPGVERATGERYPNLVLPRIDGLQELTRYRLTLWAFLE